MSRVSLLSEMYHFLAYSITKPRMQFESGMLIISIDIDVGSRQLGIMNGGLNDPNVHNRMSEYQVGEIEEATISSFVEVFDHFEVGVTFAIRGQLVEVDNSVLNLVLKSSVKHDIGAHGYFHKAFTQMSRKEAESELMMISRGMKRFGIVPRSFVFPRNLVDHLDLLEKYGYKCYREYGGFIHDSMHIEKKGRLWDVHPGLYLGQSQSSSFPRKTLDIAIAKKAPLHIWFHLWNFGQKENLVRAKIDRVLVPLLKHAKRKAAEGSLEIRTMLSASEQMEKRQLSR